MLVDSRRLQLTQILVECTKNVVEGVMHLVRHFCFGRHAAFSRFFGRRYFDMIARASIKCFSTSKAKCGRLPRSRPAQSGLAANMTGDVDGAVDKFAQLAPFPVEFGHRFVVTFVYRRCSLHRLPTPSRLFPLHSVLFGLLSL